MIDYEYAIRIRHQELLREADRARRSRQVPPRSRRRARRLDR